MHLPQYLGFIFAYVFALMIMYLYFQLYLHLYFQLLHCPPNLKSCLWVGKTWRPESRDRLPVDHQVFHIFLCGCRCCVCCFHSSFFVASLCTSLLSFWLISPRTNNSVSSPKFGQTATIYFNTSGVSMKPILTLNFIMIQVVIFHVYCSCLMLSLFQIFHIFILISSFSGRSRFFICPKGRATTTWRGRKDTSPQHQ